MRRRKEDQPLKEAVYFDFPDEAVTRMAAKIDTVQDLATFAEAHLLEPCVIFTPLAIPHRQILDEVFQQAGITLLEPEPVTDWALASAAMRIEKASHSEGRKALAYQRLWQRAGSSLVGERRRILNRSDYEKAIREKYQLRRMFPRSHFFVETPQERFHAFLHSFWIPEASEIGRFNAVVDLLSGRWSRRYSISQSPDFPQKVP